MASSSAMASREYVLNQYIHSMDLGSSRLMSQHMASDVVLDWYGRTIAGKRQVLDFLFHHNKVSSHDVSLVENIGPLTRKNTLINAMKRARLRLMETTEDDENFDDDSGFLSGLCESSSDGSFSSCGSDTPCSKALQELASMHISASGFPNSLSYGTTSLPLQTPRNCRTSAKHIMKTKINAPRKMSSNWSDLELNLSFVEAKGTVSFCSENILNENADWSRDCCLQLGYSIETHSDVLLSFSLIVYQDDMRCRRNLSRLFEQL